MKKVFTSISLALSLIASSFSTSAQTVQLSEAQKIEIQKEVLPVVFEQIKEQTGLDILGLARPQLNSDFIRVCRYLMLRVACVRILQRLIV